MSIQQISKLRNQEKGLTLKWPIEGPRRVPSEVYTDREIYNREQDYIFKSRTWNYVGLTTEVKDIGDFIQTFVGEVPVILVRDRRNKLRVFVNRCTHRGAQICHQERGNVKLFTCLYHEWSFNLDGTLVGMPFRRGIDGKGGMSPDFDSTEHGLEQLNVTERHGVVFASFSFEIESFEEYLGPGILAYFDRVCNGKTLRVIGKMQHRVHANWKLQVENVKDPFHAALLHSFFLTFGIWRSDQETHVKVDKHGRSSVLVSTATFKQAQNEQFKERLNSQNGFSLNDKRLIEYQSEYDHGSGAVMTIWPNLIFLQQLNCLVMRHVKPDGPDSCIKTWTFFGYESDSPELTQKRLYQANLFGPSGLVTIDDNEILAMVQIGSAASPNSVAVLEAGNGEGDADHMMTESAIRGFYKYYKKIMGYEDDE
ncbi:Rieske 2Fe-2S domain-containing protein [Photorhabdus tasmaniensis]